LKPAGARQPRSSDDPAQAGGGVLVDPKGQIIWYSTHMNDVYFGFLQQNGGANYANASATLTWPVGAAVFSKRLGKLCRTGIRRRGLHGKDERSASGELEGQKRQTNRHWDGPER